MSLRSLISEPRYSNGGYYPFMSLQRTLRSLDDIISPANYSSAEETAALPVRLDVKEDEKSFLVTADLPGLNEKEVEVTFDDGLLTIRGEKRVERDEKKGTWHLVERSSGSFARKLSLSAPIDASSIEAKFEKGVLMVTLPKQPEAQTNARKIEIKAA